MHDSAVVSEPPPNEGDTDAFTVWSGFAGLTAAVWTVALATGTHHVRAFRAETRELGAVTSSPRRLTLTAVARAVVIGVTLWLFGGKGGFDVPVVGWEVVRLVPPLIGVVAALPWVVTVWSTHEALGAMRDRERVAVPHRARGITSRAQWNRDVRLLRGCWRCIERSTGGLSVIVVVGIVTTGAVRSAIEEGRSAMAAGWRRGH